MMAEIAEELKMFGKARFGEHFPAIAADVKHLALFNRMMTVEHEHAFCSSDCATVAHSLAVILTFGFKPFKLEQTVGR